MVKSISRERFCPHDLNESENGTYLDEVDTFMKNRDKILLSEDSFSGTDTEVVPILNSDEEDEETDEEKEIKHFEIEEKDKNRNYSNWGKKNSYYNTDVEEVEYGSEEDAQDEEKEALKLQKEHLKDLEESDFYSLENWRPLSDSKLATANGEVYLPDSDSELENNKQIIISKNLNNLTVEERLKILKKDSPELYEFLEEFQMTFSELTKDPVLKPFNSENPISLYYSVKAHLLLNYLMNLSFYFLIKSEGAVVKEHPVIAQIVKLRNFMERFQELDEDALNVSDSPGDRNSKRSVKILNKKKLKKKESLKNPKINFKVDFNVDNLFHSSAANFKSEKEKSKDLENHVVPNPPRGKSALLKYEENLNCKKMNELCKQKSGDHDSFYNNNNSSSGNNSNNNSNHNNNHKTLLKTADDNMKSEITSSESLLKKRKKPKKRSKSKKAKLEASQSVQERRTIGKDIEKNKGLTPNRKKNNPRVKHKLKFMKALKKRKTVVPVYKEGEAGRHYGGEATGIRSYMVRSRPLSG